MKSAIEYKQQSNKLGVAVLFLVFNRLDTTKQVFNSIREAKPSRLYVAADGARADKENEKEKVKVVRDYILEQIDWECEIRTLFREENLGCKYAIISAIDWFFETETFGIILEDDCLPHQDFFRLCEDASVRYQNDRDIFAISGTNVDGINICASAGNNDDYFFSLMGGNWGWATWRRAWSNYSQSIFELCTEENWKVIEKNTNSKHTVKILKRLMNESKEAMENHAWDYQWLFIRLLLGGKSIVPKYNLISNIGFGSEATHTFDEDNPMSKLPTKALSMPLVIPTSQQVRCSYDEKFAKKFIPPSFYKRLSRYIIRNVKLFFSKK